MPVNVETPATLSVFVLTSEVFAAPADIVTAPPDKADTDKLSPVSYTHLTLPTT